MITKSLREIPIFSAEREQGKRNQIHNSVPKSPTSDSKFHFYVSHTSRAQRASSRGGSSGGVCGDGGEGQEPMGMGFVLLRFNTAGLELPCLR